MTTLYCECRAIESITDYGSYLSVQKEHKTGEIVAVYDTISDSSKMDDKWLELGKQNQKAAQKHGNRGKTKDTNVQEARELFFWLPNSWCSNDSNENQKLAQNIATEFKNKFGLDCMVALHWNKSRTNFHCHIMYSDRRTLERPIEIKATRNEYFDENWKRCTKKEAVHIIKKGEIKETKYFENVKDTRCTSSRYRVLKNDLKPWIAELTGQKIFDKNLLHIPQQKVGNCKTNAAKERIREENQMIKQYNQLVNELLDKYDQCDIDDGFYDFLDCIYEDLTNFKVNYLESKKEAISHSNGALERTKSNKRVWKRKYDPNFNHKHHQNIKFSQIEDMYDLLQWILQLFDQERNKARWQKLNFKNWQIEFNGYKRLANIQIGNEWILVSAKTIRKNSDRTYDVFLDLDQEIEFDGKSMTVEDLLIKEKYIKDKGWWER